MLEASVARGALVVIWPEALQIGRCWTVLLFLSCALAQRSGPVQIAASLVLVIAFWRNGHRTAVPAGGLVFANWCHGIQRAGTRERGSSV